MEFSEAHYRLRRAAEFIASREQDSDRASVLLGAWEHLRGLRSDDFPVQFRAVFQYLQHEISRHEHGEITLREADFLLQKIRTFELKWIE